MKKLMILALMTLTTTAMADERIVCKQTTLQTANGTNGKTYETTSQIKLIINDTGTYGRITMSEDGDVYVNRAEIYIQQNSNFKAFIKGKTDDVSITVRLPDTRTGKFSISYLYLIEGEDSWKSCDWHLMTDCESRYYKNIFHY